MTRRGIFLNRNVNSDTIRTLRTVCQPVIASPFCDTVAFGSITMKRTIERLQQESAAHPEAGVQAWVWRDGDVLLDIALGNARSNVPMRTDSLTLWMSAGKPLAAVAMLQLIVRGLATLDTRVAEIIPEFAQLGKDAVTIRHILTHTAGFRGPLNNFTTGTFTEIVARACALRQEPSWVPGQKAGYHIGSSWFILGELIRRLDGRDYSTYVRQEVLAPVGAHHSSVGLSDEEIETLGDRIALAQPDFPGNTIDAMAVCRPGANARGPIRELGLFYRSLLLNDETLLPCEWVTQATSPQRVGMMDQTFKRIIDWAWGFKLDSKQYGPGEPYGYGKHASAKTFGHSGNQTSCALADPQHHLVAAWICTFMPGEETHQPRQNAINEAIYEDVLQLRVES